MKDKPGSIGEQLGQRQSMKESWGKVSIELDEQMADGQISAEQKAAIDQFVIDHLQRHFPEGPQEASYAQECFFEEFYGAILPDAQCKAIKRFIECEHSAYEEYKRASGQGLPMTFHNDVDLRAYGGQDRLDREIDNFGEEEKAQVERRIKEIRDDNRTNHDREPGLER